ncbi:ribosome small subunit-dependent GTPase A [Hasllibacter sp. MH4015]|uniref:ribosome small subunit-dependent GTPase A n=1 Tax=Hasllibacter sp. MH4015 TaxID=2854029 RepID=UPI001CD77088|nr:ribosome small subunit-dependent GTPase A [Hasllibacter sp. MH4015]
MTTYSLADLGWSARHLSLLSPEEVADPHPARLTTIARDRAFALSASGPISLLTPSGLRTGDLVTGDWVLTDPDQTTITRLLDRDTLLSRRAAGEGRETQLIAANVDTLGIVTSCNADFNEARLERYLALAASAGCLPLIILTKADQCDDPGDFVRRAENLSPMVTAIALNAKAPDVVDTLRPWAGNGQTLALVGSSGVGKTTLSNALTGAAEATADIREDDAKGRHTTTSRGLARTIHGGWLIDTPGMRSLPLTDAADGIEAVFADIEALTQQCRFNDCAHATEPGCAVQTAVASGDLDPDRLKRFLKLMREDAINSEQVHESRARQKNLHKMYRSTQNAGRSRKGGT